MVICWWYRLLYDGVVYLYYIVVEGQSIGWLVSPAGMYIFDNNNDNNIMIIIIIITPCTRMCLLLHGGGVVEYTYVVFVYQYVVIIYGLGLQNYWHADTAPPSSDFSVSRELLAIDGRSSSTITMQSLINIKNNNNNNNIMCRIVPIQSLMMPPPPLLLSLPGLSLFWTPRGSLPSFRFLINNDYR